MTELNDMNDAAIAIIGMAGRFPGAPSLQDFWRHLCAGDEMITRFSDAELRAAGVPAALLDDPRYVRAGAVLPAHDHFDAAFFGFSPREAELLDPQQRLLLETAWEALDVAGYSDRTLPGRGSIGVFAGSGLNHYLLEHLHPNVALKSAVGAYQMFLVNSPDSVAMRLSYKLNLTGPSMTVQTACSTSLVAVHQACQSLLSGECDLALAGGVSLLLPQDQGYLHQEGMILSPDGHCRPFSEDAAGTLGGSGVGMVLLKPLAEALADGDVVHAVIRGSAINNDGAAKISFTAPSVEGQSRVIREAQAVAEVEPDSIGYVEAHGTGTPLGDPIEVAALTEAFRSQRRGVCALGSVKSNIGHADAAAGVAGLIKATLALQHGLIPPSLHAERPNPALKLEQSPFYIASAPTPWPRSAAPRRAGVSAFGVGGTNAHVVLQETPPTPPSAPGRPQQLLLLSARSEDGLVAHARALAARLAEAPDLMLADVACSLAHGRQHHPVRGVLLSRDTAKAAVALAAAANDGSVCSGQAPETPRPVVFMFPGQGTQTVDMGRELYDTEPVFRAQVNRCAELLQPLTGYDLRERLYAAPGDRQTAEDHIHQPSVTQPALFVVSYALAQLWLSWGVKPQAMIGHSFGEYVAATVAGVLSLPDALGLVALRGRLMEAQPEGAMLAVSLAAEQLALPPGVALAAVNGPAMCVVSGTPQDIAAFQQHLSTQGVPHRRLHVNRAFHSAMMEPVLAPLVAHLRTLTLRAPRIPYLSNLTGTWITDSEATDPAHWARHTREPVQFARGMAVLAKEPALILLEVGPGRALGALARQQPDMTEQLVLRSTPQPQEARSERECLLDALGQLWTAGGQVDWAGFFDLGQARRQRVTLPTCPFERQRYWIERPVAGEAPLRVQAEGLHPSADPAPPTPAASGSLQAHVKRRGGRHPHVAARNPVEQGLIGIWQELLGVADIGVNDDFWALGGHSLLATQVIAHIRKVFQVALSMKTLFEAPTVAGLASTIAHRQGVASGVADRQDPGMTLVPRATTTTSVPLSFAQQRLWFLTQFEANPSLYNIQAAIHLHGALQVAALEQAFQTVEARHASLRTSFPEHAGQPCQRVHPPSFRLAVTDLCAWPEDRQQAKVMRQIRQQSDQTFDLANGPLWNAALLRLGPTHHVLTLTLHHAIADGWSMGILMQELSALYGVLVAGRPAAAAGLPTLPVQYADYAVWQREWLRGPVLEAQLDYWRQRLDGAPPLLTLPTDHPRPAVQRGVGDKFVFLVPSELTEALKQLGRAESATLFMVVQTVFSVLLARYAGQDDILIGTPSANRQFAETEPLIGLFLNALVLRTDVSGNPSVRALLARVREGDLEAFQRHALPFETLVEALRPERSLAYTPVFQVMFNLLTSRSHALTLEGLHTEHIAIQDGMAKHDLTLMMHEIDTGLHTVLEYDTDLFERATIERMAGHFRSLLEAAVADPDQPVGTLPMLTAAERDLLLVHWNDNATADAGTSDYLTRFEAQVAATPERIAVRWQPEPGGAIASLSYAALDRRANQLAQVLHARGVGGEVGREDIVGVCLERSADTLVAMLALFKVGAAYMPLDPALPDERLALLVHQARVPLVLTRATQADRLARVMPDMPLLCPDREATALETLPAQPPAGVRRDPARLAYVLFTSGSTGLPKGVMIEHRGLVNNLHAKVNDHGLGVADTLAQTAPPGFDISVWQFLAAPWVGGTVRIFGDEIAKDPALLLRHVEAERVTVLEVVPSLLRFMLDEVDAARAAGEAVPTLAALRWLSLTGEALPPALCAAWFARYPQIPILNAYGPAECSDDATHHILRGPLPPGADTVPIGRALPNVRLYVLDEHLQPLPVGVAGELCIGGIGVGRGYLHDPERTQAAFRPDPWAGRPDARLYRTGDRARWRADGTLEFLGRLDFQVKLRGLRIELGEIEATLVRHPAVRQSVVVVHVDPHGEPQLVAHVATDPDSAPSESALGAYLAGLLPAYMVPARILLHEALPLTPNGKIDRRRLPVPDPQDAAGQDAFVAPATPTEQQLAGIWQKVLRMERIGRHDHFFALGGHSLLATQVVSRLRRQLGIELPLRTLFATPVLAALATQIDQMLLLRQVGQASDDFANEEREEILI